MQWKTYILLQVIARLPSAFQQHGCGVIAPWRCRHRLRPYDCCRICQRRFRSEQCLSWYCFERRTHQYANSGQTLDSIVRYAARSGIQLHLMAKARSRREVSVVPRTAVAAKHSHFVCQVASSRPPTAPQLWTIKLYRELSSS
jgi:hypothetical protein